MNQRPPIFALLIVLFAPIPAAAAEPVGTRPLGSPGEWVTSEDYPADPLMNEREGVTRFRLTVNKEGLVSNCEITQSSGTDELDFATCSLITQRARFAPARDRRGRPEVGTYSNSVRWMIPNAGSPYPHPEPMTQTWSFNVELDGSVSSCEGMENLPEALRLTADGCPVVSFEPYVGSDGQPQRKRVRFDFKVTPEDIP